MFKKCCTASIMLCVVIGGMLHSWPSSQVAGRSAGTRKARRSRRAKPTFENFTGADPVAEVPLTNYSWMELEWRVGELLEPALGPEVAYWKARGVTCEDIVSTVRELHSIFLHSVRVVLIRNQTWHFLNPAVTLQPPRGDPGGGASRFSWPQLAPNPPDTCLSPCQAQLRYVHQTVAARLPGWRSERPEPDTGPPRYTLPDMVFVINAADNMQRFGALTEAPLLSLMKWWRGPMAAAAAAAAGPSGAGPSTAAGGVSPGQRTSSTDGTPRVSLGRINGALLHPLELPGNVAELRAAVAAGSAGMGATGGGTGRTSSAAGRQVEPEDADLLWDAVRRFVATRSPDLPPGVELRPRRQKGEGSGGGGGGGGASTRGGRKRAGKDAEAPPKRRDYDMDLLLPTMTFAPRSLSYFPWEKKKDIAFFRGIAFCPLYTDLHPICPRAFLANVSMAGHFQNDLDVRLVRRFRGRLGSQDPYRQRVTLKGSLPTLPRDHARYRYLLNMDGLAGSTRMGVLMATDSVILKSRSPYIEYYSRLQVPGAHYLEFWKDPNDPLDVVKVVAQARAATAADPAGARAAAEANQAIAARFVAMEPKLIYARAALLAYHALVHDMDECVEDLVRHLERTGHPLPEPGAPEPAT